MTNETAVEEDIIESVASDYSITATELSNLLRSTSIETATPEQKEAVDECYTLQRYRNELGKQLKQAAKNDSYRLVDTDGIVFWVDKYDGFGAYIHTDEGDTHYVSLQRLFDSFTVEDM